MSLTFRFHQGIRLSYDRQGYIYFKSRLYHQLPEEEKKRMNEIINAAGGEYRTALFVFVTTDHGARYICVRYGLSKATLYRAVKRYYESFDL